MLSVIGMTFSKLNRGTSTAPAPYGQISIGLTPPIRITGMYILDSLLTFNFTD